jgi:hypothetical protein
VGVKETKMAKEQQQSLSEQQSSTEPGPSTETPLPVVALPPADPVTGEVPLAPRPDAADLAKVVNDPGRAISAFSGGEAFTTAQRMAKALASSSLMPKDYQNNIPNTLIAIELASRIGCSVLMVAQNLDIIHGRPSWRATFLIATVNACGRFTPLRFRWQGEEGTLTWGCRAVAKDRTTGEECIGTLITLGLAKAEGWSSKNGSKWATMPEQMLCYRAAAFWTRIYAPELSLGMSTNDEVIDTYGEDVTAVPAGLRPGNTASLEAALREKPAANGA